MKRSPLSHKGENGTVAVIGGSHLFHGAPIFSGLAAEASGVDLVYPFVHECHAQVTRLASPGFIVRSCKSSNLTKEDVKEILALLREVHAAVIGPGMAETKQNEAALRLIVANAPCPLVLDARALWPGIVKSISKKIPTVLTPHLGELEHLTNKNLTGVSRKDIQALTTTFAKEHQVTIILKGPEDFIVDAEGKKKIVKGGNAGLTKGGTGDALAGLIAGLLAQGMKPFDACVMAATLMKRAGTVLYPEKGFAYSTREVIEQIPYLIHTFKN